MPYTYIERAYGKRFEAGQRVRFTEYKGARGLGVVRGVRDDPQYVQVLFDDWHQGPCHPGSLEIIPKTEPRRYPVTGQEFVDTWAQSFSDADKRVIVDVINSAVTAEREACARIAQDYADIIEHLPWVKTATDIRDRIRARNNAQG